MVGESTGEVQSELCAVCSQQYEVIYCTVKLEWSNKRKEYGTTIRVQINKLKDAKTHEQNEKPKTELKSRHLNITLWMIT